MKLIQRVFQTAVFSVPLLLIFAGSSVYADESQPDTPQSMECVTISGIAKLVPDLDCKIATNHHRTEQFPETDFLYDVAPGNCTDPNQPCCVKGMMGGTMSWTTDEATDDEEEVTYDFISEVACGFTLNQFNQEVTEALLDLGYQQFTARTLMRVFFNTTQIPVHPNPEEKVKADFGLFLGDAGVSRPDPLDSSNNLVSVRMVLSGARKLPHGAKMKLDMEGYPIVNSMSEEPQAMIEGRLCAPQLHGALEIIAEQGSEGNADQDDDDDEEEENGDEES